LLRVEELVVEFPVGHTGLKVHAVTNVSLDVLPGETLGLVGESGCGKSTTGKAIMQLPRPKSGKVLFDGTDMTTLEGGELRRTRTAMKMIFQDPISSLNPRRKVEDIIAEGLKIWKIGSDDEQAEKVDEAMLAVGLDPALQRGRRPHQFSGGQCQRISIARAVVTDPKLIICDEPVSALDVSVQAQILNLLEDMKHRYGLTLIFIAHDLAVVKNVSDRVIVMYLGKLCEVSPPDALYAEPAHPYTAALLSAIPVPDPSATMHTPASLQGELPSPLAPPSGCRFRTRCWKAQEICAEQEPELVDRGTGHPTACHFAEIVKPLDNAEEPATAASPAAGSPAAGA
jgi:peptide/nickel transport system ATP-binding protein